MTSESPMKLRNRQTPSKGGNDSFTSHQNYDSVIKTPIGKRRSNSENSKLPTGPATRKSSRMLQFSGENGMTDTTTAIIEQDGSECSYGTSGSNVENESIVCIKENNENTPTKPVNRLSRNRAVKNSAAASSKTFAIYKKSDDEQNNLKFTIRAQSTADSVSTPRAREMSLRQSTIMRRNSIYYNMDDTLSDKEDHLNVSAKRKRNASYFSAKDYEDYCPESSEDEEEEPHISEDDNQEDNSSDDTDEEESKTTPKKGFVMSQDLSKLTLTPELLTRIEGRFVRRRIGVNSPVATSSQTMSPNPETYFLAENRIKFKKVSKQPEVMNDAMKGKRRRKIKIGVEGRLPEKIPTDFSVTTEAMKAAVNLSSENFISGNIHEEEVDQLFQNIVENEFPHWLGLFRDQFNVMLYGYGSKLSIFREFEKFVNKDYLTVTINGLFPKLNPRKLLYGICENINPEGHNPHGVNLEAVAKDAVKVLKTIEHSDVFILVSNFDSMVLRYPQMLTILCWLSQIPYIHILASCDTVNAFLGVTQSQALQLNFCWMHCPTYFSYREELKWIPGVYGDETKIVTQKSSLKYVLQSLTGNARKSFALLAQMQLKQMKSRAVQKSKETYAGVRFQELAKECREKFIAHSDENLRTLLVEFFDHKLIRQTGKGKHLENTLLIELDVETLEEIIPELS